MVAGKKIKVRLVHWNEKEAQNRIKQLVSADVEVVYEMIDSDTLRKLGKDSPMLIVIDLNRLPAQGRDFGLAIRKKKQTRHIPLLFVGGQPNKVTKIKQFLPDATFTSWSMIEEGLLDALEHAPDDPIVPDSVLAGYSGTPLPKKLGIRQASDLILINAPKDFKTTLGSLPADVRFNWITQSDATSQEIKIGDRKHVALWFVRSRMELEDGVMDMSPFAEGGGLWIIWPKKASKFSTDVTQVDVRRVGLSSRMVDFKVCAVDDTWSGLRFSIRKL